MAGIFFWTGFDYRGEANPYGWPQVIAQNGIVDLCGFPKNPYYYLKSWWTDKPVLHIFPHWNWKGKEGQPINVWVYSNCDEVELFLNGKSLGRKSMPKLSHIEWNVPYQPGILMAQGYKNGKKIIAGKTETTGYPAVIRLISDRTSIHADGEDMSVITVQVEDANGHTDLTADNEISFHLQGAGKIIGVGNGDPSSHEPDVFTDIIQIEKINRLKMSFTRTKQNFQEVNYNFDDSEWTAFHQTNRVNSPQTDTLIIVRGLFNLPVIADNIKVTLFSKSICENQSVYVNEYMLGKDILRGAPNQEFKLDDSILKQGENIFSVIGTPFIKTQLYEDLNIDPGVVQVFIPAETWKRNAFNGLAQIVVQSDQQPGKIKLTATSPGLKPAAIQLQAKAVPLRPAVPAK